MAFKIENFYSEQANAKSILGGVCYYKYRNADGDTVTTSKYFPANLGLKAGDRITIIPATLSSADVAYYVSAVAADGVTIAALS